MTMLFVCRAQCSLARAITFYPRHFSIAARLNDSLRLSEEQTRTSLLERVPAATTASPGDALISVAPMIDVTDRFFLQLLRAASPLNSDVTTDTDGHDAVTDRTNDFVTRRYAFYTEMHYARKITRLAQEGGPARIHTDLGAPCPRTVVQLGGSDPDWVADAYEALVEAGYSEVNLNLGCPSDSVQAGCFGAVLMKTPDQVYRILKAVEAKRLAVPFTIKCRVGVDDLDSDAYLHEFISTLTNDTSLKHVIIHARKAHLKGLSPKENRTVPPLNYSRVKTIKKAFPQLRITLNGGLSTTEQVKAELDWADGVMIGRKFRDDPLFIQQLDRDLFGVDPDTQPTPRQVVDRYLEMIEPELHKLGRPTLPLRPLLGLFPGNSGRFFRQWMQEYITSCRRTAHMPNPADRAWQPERLRSTVLEAFDREMERRALVAAWTEQAMIALQLRRTSELAVSQTGVATMD